MAKRTNATSPKRVAARDRQAQAVQLRRQGFTYEAIARALGFESRASAYKAVRTAMDAVVHEEAEMLVRLEVERLDALHRVAWPMAVSGNLYAIDRVIKIMDRKARLFGLYANPPTFRVRVNEPTPVPHVHLDLDPEKRDRLYAALATLFDLNEPTPQA